MPYDLPDIVVPYSSLINNVLWWQPSWISKPILYQAQSNEYSCKVLFIFTLGSIFI